MSDTPDLSRIINMILDNPRLVEEISRMAKSDATASPKTEDSEPASIAVEENTEKQDKSVSASAKAQKREMLISALKPYLSENRAKAIDSMVSVAQMLEIMKPR